MPVLSSASPHELPVHEMHDHALLPLLVQKTSAQGAELP